MVDNSQDSYLVCALDPDLLSAAFKIRTNWHVISGAPCSGKTTLINRLSRAEYHTTIETARQYFGIEMAKGRTSQEIRDSGHQIQQGIFDLQQRLEDGLRPEQVVFLDRGLPDSLTFNLLFGINPDEFLLECRKHCYASVFILDRLPFAREVQLGPEDEKSAQFIDMWLERDYTTLGYHVVRVPVCSPKDRLGFVLDRIPDPKKSG